jgi:hypothetical protein
LLSSLGCDWSGASTAPAAETASPGQAPVDESTPAVIDGQSPPSEEDARAWARHFGMDRQQNEVVLIGDQRFISPETRRLIPGFHLIDQNGILRAMSSNDPRHDRFTSLLPKLASLVQARAR